MMTMAMMTMTMRPRMQDNDVDNASMMAKYCADNDNDLIQGRRRTEGLRPGNI